jgi:uncharacterized protein
MKKQKKTVKHKKKTSQRKNTRQQKVTKKPFPFRPYLYAFIAASILFVAVSGLYFVYEQSSKKAVVSDTKIAESKPQFKSRQLASLPQPKIAPQTIVPNATVPTKPVEVKPFVAPQPVLPRIVIVIDDMGVDVNRSLRAVKLPKDVTLSYMSYATNVAEQTKAASALGHELLVHVPMEPINVAVNAGPQVLATSLKDAELQKRMKWHLSQFKGYVGLNNHMGSKFTGNARCLRAVMGEVKKRNLIFFDSKTTIESVVPSISEEMQVPCVVRDVFLDHDPSLAAIEKQIARLESIARNRGQAIAIGHPRDTTLVALEKWLPLLPKRGLKLVPISEML